MFKFAHRDNSMVKFNSTEISICLKLGITEKISPVREGEERQERCKIYSFMGLLQEKAFIY